MAFDSELYTPPDSLAEITKEHRLLDNLIVRGVISVATTALVTSALLGSLIGWLATASAKT
jgi:hypothetical protein